MISVKNQTRTERIDEIIKLGNGKFVKKFFAGGLLAIGFKGTEIYYRPSYSFEGCVWSAEWFIRIKPYIMSKDKFEKISFEEVMDIPNLPEEFYFNLDVFRS